MSVSRRAQRRHGSQVQIEGCLSIPQPNLLQTDNRVGALDPKRGLTTPSSPPPPFPAHHCLDHGDASSSQEASTPSLRSRSTSLSLHFSSATVSLSALERLSLSSPLSPSSPPAHDLSCDVEADCSTVGRDERIESDASTLSASLVDSSLVFHLACYLKVSGVHRGCVI